MRPSLPSVTLSIELSTNIHEKRPRERCPGARVISSTTVDRHDLGVIRVDVEKPRIDRPDCSQRTVDAGDVISRAIDEVAWLAETARILEPGGILHLRLPASGPLAWFDARNLYRYVGDILRRGNSPDDTRPTGWNRHYSPEDASAMLLDAGFTDIQVRRTGMGIAEPPQMAGLVMGNFFLGRRDTELRLNPLRRAMERFDVRIPAPIIGTMLVITARRARTEPGDPAADEASANRPAPEIASE